MCPLCCENLCSAAQCVPFLQGRWGSCGQQIQANVQRPIKQNASPGEQSEAPRPRWKPEQEQNPGPQNQDSQHMLEQPREYFPDRFWTPLGACLETLSGFQTLWRLFRDSRLSGDSFGIPGTEATGEGESGESKWQLLNGSRRMSGKPRIWLVCPSRSTFSQAPRSYFLWILAEKSTVIGPPGGGV